MTHVGHVFGYGSLVDAGQLQRYLGRPMVEGEDYRFCSLGGYRRRWNVAMDNAVDLPGYKYYLDRATGERPPVVVAFLNLEPAAAGSVDGIVFRIGRRDLERLDRRERNYARIDVTAELSVALPGPVWAYAGRPEARRRFDVGVAEGRAVIGSDYHDAVVEGFRRRGRPSLRRFHASTEAPTVPLRALDPRRVPDGGADRQRADPPSADPRQP